MPWSLLLVWAFIELYLYHIFSAMVFKTETKIGTKYEKSAFYQGTKLWNNLSREIQESEDK